MTREEVIERIKVLKARCERLALNINRGFSEWKMDAEACEIAISALTPLPQERMKELYPGCDFCKKELNDYPLISACTLIITIMVLLANLFVEILYGVIDPRIKASQQD